MDVLQKNITHFFSIQFIQHILLKFKLKNTFFFQFENDFESEFYSVLNKSVPKIS